jgi:hypothetical protein
MQPITGRHIGSLIDQQHFDVKHHEDWYGPFDPAKCGGYDLVFLTGFQPDFDQHAPARIFLWAPVSPWSQGEASAVHFLDLAHSSLTLWCCRVDSAPEVVADFMRCSLKAICGSPANRNLDL